MRVVLAAGVALALPAAAPAAVLFNDNFDINTSALYTVNADPDTLAQFSYDYSAMGIPSAPNSIGGTTRGLLFKANYGDATPATAAINVSPTGQSFIGDYVLRFDLWPNVNGPFPGGGSGSNQFFTAGVGNNGAAVQKSSGAANGPWFAADTDGENGVDFRAYRATALEGGTSPAYAAPDDGPINRRSADNSYYHGTFPGGQEAPLSQQITWPVQSGMMKPGTLGFVWRDVAITRIGNNVSWTIDGLPIATLTNPVLGGNNIFVGLWDPANSIADNTAVLFGVVDNLRVSDVPEPTSLALLALTLALPRRRRRSSL
jgi:hypothetical protein